MTPVLHSVSYAGLWGQDALHLDEFIDHAKALGYAGVMLMSKRPHLSPLDYDEKRLDQLAQRLRGNNLSVACIAAYSDPGCGFSAAAAPFAPIGEMQLVNIRHYARMAQKLGAPVIRLLTGPAASGEPYTVQWRRCVEFMREACDIAAACGIVIGIQNHDDIAGHYLSIADLIDEIGRPNCKACFDAWSVALQGGDLAEAVRCMGDRIVHTTVADYVKRPRFRYHHPGEGNVYERMLDEVRAVPPGEGFIDYPQFFDALREIGFNGTVGFEMCSPIRGGGKRENLDRYAKQFLQLFQPWMNK
ncbi:MAG: sugar phosphate isomerase/epimerase [Candidatus Omnitrophica bacterium]|nr:sugar phosphate isomerase/epimerase [Candidatus Omnitrophota bacterium]